MTKVVSGKNIFFFHFNAEYFFTRTIKIFLRDWVQLIIQPRYLQCRFHTNLMIIILNIICGHKK